tara:strand:+ start:2970 stop:3629 length:660 start_codon:yes stop_codon:yes gene_type:complete
VANTFVQIPSELLTDKAVSALELRLYCVLMDLGFKGRGYSQAGHQYLGKLLDTHPQTIAKCLKNLRQLGWICVDRVGLNRNDKIRCLKTVQREKRSESRVSVKDNTSHIGHSTNRKKNKKRIEVEVPKVEPELRKTTPPDPRRAERSKGYSEANNAFHKSLQRASRPSTYKTFYESLLVVEDGEKLLVSIENEGQMDFMNSLHKARIEEAVGREVELVL